MLQLAQDMIKALQARVRTTLHTVAGLAESVGVPAPVTTLLHGLERMTGAPEQEPWNAESAACSCGDRAPRISPPDTDPWATSHAEPTSTFEPAVTNGNARKRATGKKRGLVGARDLSDQVRPLEVDDAINGSTYLARIVWSLGVAELEGNGALRPADMARMIMARSPVSLEPPNVARYIRRSKPTCIAVDHVEGGSSFYRLNDEGHALFDERFRIK